MKHNINDKRIVKSICTGVIITLALIVVGISICAWIILKKNIDDRVIKYIASAVLFISSYFGNIVGINKITTSKWKSAAIISSILFVFLIGINCIIPDYQPENIISILFTICIGGIAACLTYAGRRSKIKKYRNG